MALTDESLSGSSAQVPPTQPAQESSGNTAQANIPQHSGLSGIQARLANPLSRSSAGEAVNKLVEGIKKILTNEGDAVKDVGVLVVDGQVRGSVLSSILICRRLQDRVTTFNLIVEASANRLSNTEQTINNTKVETPTVPGDVNNAGFWDKCITVVQERYGRVTVQYAGASVIPRELSAEDTARLRAIVYYADTAVWTTMANSSTTPPEPFSVTWLTNKEKLQARLDFQPQPQETAAGLPIRSDVSVVLTGSTINGSDPLLAGSQDFSRVDGYVDLVYDPPGQPALGMIQQTQHYWARLVMTLAAPQLNAITPELLLLSIGSSTLLSRNMAWANVFRPRYGAGTNLRDIGAIGFDVPSYAGSVEPKKIDTQSATWTVDNLFSLLTAAVRPSLIYSIDVEETGDLSWLQLLLVGAANGDPEAYGLITRAADNLTAGRFSQRFANGGPIVVDDNNRIFLGYYQENNNGVIEKRDIRSIDYLAMLNHVGQTDMKAVVDYTNTFDQTNVELPIRLEKRLRILEKVLGETLRITGYARRVTFTPAFIEALALAIVDAGLNIQPSNVYSDMGGNVRRGNENIAAMAYGGTAVQNLFNYGNNINRSGGAGASYRWGGR